MIIEFIMQIQQSYGSKCYKGPSQNVLSPWPTRYLPIARVTVSEKFGRTLCHSSVQPCARTDARCILRMTCIFRGYKRNCEIINNVRGQIVFLKRLGRNHDQLIN